MNKRNNLTLFLQKQQDDKVELIDSEEKYWEENTLYEIIHSSESEVPEGSICIVYGNPPSKDSYYCWLQLGNSHNIYKFSRDQARKLRIIRRPAREGEYVMLTNRAPYTFNKAYDILRVTESYPRDGRIIVYHKDHITRRCVYSRRNWHYSSDHYVVLENYIPFEAERGDNS